MSDGIGFDIYGTLVDPLEMNEQLRPFAGEQADRMSQLWRDKQIEYTFRRGLMRAYEDFGVLTRQSLIFAARALEVDLSEEDQEKLIEEYQNLRPFPDVIPGIKALKREGRVLVAFSNGVEAMARTLRKPLPEEVDFMHATREELSQLRRAIYPLTRRLAVRLARKRRHGRKGPLDFRNTMRHSLSYGGVPAEPKFKYPRPAKPEIMVIADISGSVAAFARFTLHLVYAMNTTFSKVRSFVFIDGIDEVTKYFEGVEDITESITRINAEADVIWVDGHSDYGHAFEEFWKRWGKEIGPKTTVIILGDARNNYHASQSWVLKEMQHKARHVYWLNPEPRSYWDTGDSIVGEYATHCDGVFECRNLRQLERFVDVLQ